MEKLKYIVCLVILTACSSKQADESYIGMADEEVSAVTEQNEGVLEYPWEESEIEISEAQEVILPEEERTENKDEIEEKTDSWSNMDNNQNVNYNVSSKADEILLEETTTFTVTDNFQDKKISINHILTQYCQQNLEDFLDLLILYQDKQIGNEIRSAALEALNVFLNKNMQTKLDNFPSIEKENIQELRIESLQEKEGNLFGKLLIKQGNKNHHILFEIQNTRIPDGMQRQFKVVGVL